MKQFQNAVFLDPKNVTAEANMAGVIRMLGWKPNNFQDRVDLGDQARLVNDIAGSIIEYRAALQIRDEPEVRAKLRELTNSIDRCWRSME